MPGPYYDTVDEGLSFSSIKSINARAVGNAKRKKSKRAQIPEVQMREDLEALRRER